MKCNKCNYTSFDYHHFCPKCNTDLTNLKKNLNIISFEINDLNNYLRELKSVDDTVDTLVESEETTQESNFEEASVSNHIQDTPVKDSDEISLESIDFDKSKTDSKNEEGNDAISLENILENNEPASIQTESNNQPSEQVNGLETTKSDDDEISLDDIDLGDLLETNREE